MGKILFSLVMLIAFASSASAQFSTYPRTTEPAYWMSGGVGTFNAQRVNDGSTAEAACMSLLAGEMQFLSNESPPIRPIRAIWNRSRRQISWQ